MSEWHSDPAERAVDELLEFIAETVGDTPKGRVAKRIVEELAGRRATAKVALTQALFDEVRRAAGAVVALPRLERHERARAARARAAELHEEARAVRAQARQQMNRYSEQCDLRARG